MGQAGTCLLRMRQFIFASPHRLYVQLCCKPRNSVRKHLSSWQTFAVIVDYGDQRSLSPGDEDNIIAAAPEHPDRVYALDLVVTSTQLAQLIAVMQEPYLALKRLALI